MPRVLRCLFLAIGCAILALAAIVAAERLARAPGGADGVAPLPLAGDTLLAAAAAGTALLAAVALVLAWRVTTRTFEAGARAHLALAQSSQEANCLLRMTEALQRSQGPADVAQVLGEVVGRVMPGASGALRLVSPATGEETECFALGLPSELGPRVGEDRCAALQERRMQSPGGHACDCCPAMGAAGRGLCLPLVADGMPYGVLQLRGDIRPASAACQRIGLAMAGAASLALANLSLRESLRLQAHRDPLTGLHNRRFLDEVLEGIALQAARRGSPIAVAMLDLDHFKRLNDRHGHAAGDRVLRAAASLLLRSLRRSDIACRYGGEEFLMVLPDCDALQAGQRMDRLRRDIASGKLMGEDGHRVTCSIGVAALPGDGATMEAVIRQADAALYAAKKAGRNRVMLAQRLAEGRQGRLGLLDEATPPGRPALLLME